MSGGKKRSGFQITSVTSELQSESSVASHGASSHPSTPSLKKKYVSHDALGSNSNSRFRVVRLAGGGGRGLPYRRGRWTCSDFLERQEGAGIRRVIDSMRHAHSLESLELIGRETDRGGVHSQEPIGGLHRSALLGPIASHGLDPAPPPSPRPRVIPPPLRLDRDADGRSVLRLSHSQPSSPPLDQTIFNLEGDDSSSSNSLIAIDNKIEQAMDLVKSHLMLAVREEVEQMKDQIKDLQDENQRLERENHILRTLTRNIHT